MKVRASRRVARRRRGLAYFVLLVAALATAWPVAAQPRGFRLEGLNGGHLQATDLDQGTIVAIVWASWSPRCRDIVQRANAISDRWGREVRVITVNFQEDEADVRDFLGNQSLKAPIFLDRDGAFSKRYAVTHLPGLLIFRDGQTRFSGRLSRDPDPVISESLR